MIRGFGSYKRDDLEVDFSATGTVEDYGVPGSPEFICWDNFEVVSLTICGVAIDDLKKLPADLADAIEGLHSEVDFEADE